MDSSTISGITIKNSPVQVFSIDGATTLALDNIFIDNSVGDSAGAANTDGFDVGDSSGVAISGANVKNQDDCLAINSGTVSLPLLVGDLTLTVCYNRILISQVVHVQGGTAYPSVRLAVETTTLYQMSRLQAPKFLTAKMVLELRLFTELQEASQQLLIVIFNCPILHTMELS